MGPNKVVCVLNERSMPVAMAHADLAKSSIKDVCSRILNDYFMSRSDALTRYVAAKAEVMGSDFLTGYIGVPESAKKHLDGLIPATGSHDGYFLENSKVYALFGSVSNRKVVAFMKMLGFRPSVARVDGKTFRGYWVQSRPGVPADDRLGEIQSFI